MLVFFFLRCFAKEARENEWKKEARNSGFSACCSCNSPRFNTNPLSYRARESVLMQTLRIPIEPKNPCRKYYGEGHGNCLQAGEANGYKLKTTGPIFTYTSRTKPKHRPPMVDGDPCTKKGLGSFGLLNRSEVHVHTLLCLEQPDPRAPCTRFTAAHNSGERVK